MGRLTYSRTNAHKKPPKPCHDLNVAGMKAHAALADEFGATPWWHGGGSLEWEAEPDRAVPRSRHFPAEYTNADEWADPVPRVDEELASSISPRWP